MSQGELIVWISQSDGRKLGVRESCRIINSSSIQYAHPASHQSCKLVIAEVHEFWPSGHDDHKVGTFHTCLGVRGIGYDRTQLPLRPVHCHRVVGSDHGSLADEFPDHRMARDSRISSVFGLKARPKTAIFFPSTRLSIFSACETTLSGCVSLTSSVDSSIDGSTPSLFA